MKPDSDLTTDEDPTFYIEEDHMGESSFQFFVVHRLVALLLYYMECESRSVFVSGNQFMHLERGNSQANLAPDVYIIDDEQLAEYDVRSWKLWEHDGKGPCLAVEVVADDPDEAKKDYVPEMLAKYTRMGVKDLFRYDPYGVGRRLGGQKRRLLTHWVRTPQGELREQTLTDPWRAQSSQFGFWLVHTPPRGLALGVGPGGRVRFRSREEALADRADMESRRAEEESRRAEEESRRADAAERELQAARAELERLKGEGTTGRPKPSRGRNKG